MQYQPQPNMVLSFAATLSLSWICRLSRPVFRSVSMSARRLPICGGSGQDSMTLAIGHREGDRAVVDAQRERRPPFSPADVVAEFGGLLKSYRITRVQGDRWGGEFVREPFRSIGCEFDLAAKPKSDLYRDLLPAINSRKVDLLDHPKTVAQAVGLERKTARSGRDSIDHAPGAHDDLINSVAGLVEMLATQSTYGWTWEAIGGPPPDPKGEAAQPPSWAQERSLYEHPALFGANVFGFPFRR
jgi:hypothetical protein